MLFHPPGCWDAGLKFGSEWELLVESYCYSDPHNVDFEIPGPEGKVGNQISLNHVILSPVPSCMHTFSDSHAAITVICIPLQSIALFCDGLGYGNLCGLANDPAIWPEDVRPEDYDMLDTVGQENCR